MGKAARREAESDPSASLASMMSRQSFFIGHAESCRHPPQFLWERERASPRFHLRKGC